MGTRSITHIQFRHAGKVQPVVTFYRQYDGYPEAHGLEMAKILNGFKPTGDKLGEFANGHDDMAFQFLAILKSAHGPYNLYLTPVGGENMGEEFIYTVTFGEEATFIAFKDLCGPGEQDELNPAQFIQTYDPNLQVQQPDQDPELPF
jgi:hypothetical protein